MGSVPISMTGILLLEQSLNSLQFGLMLFLLAAGLTLVFGIMDMINLAHGSLYMIGAYLMASFVQATGSFWIALPLALVATALVGAALEVSLLRKLYERDHLTQVLATFAIILIANEVVRLIWGTQSIMLNPPPALTGPVELPGGMRYASYRLAIIGVGAAVAVLLYFLVTKTRVGMLVRAGASNREMAVAMGVNIRRLFTVVFAAGAALCALAGAMLGPILAVQVGMGENILILAFVVIVIGGIGSIRGAFVGALLVGLVDTMGRALLPFAFAKMFPPQVASNLGPALELDPDLRADGGGAVLPPAGTVPGPRMKKIVVLGVFLIFPLVMHALDQHFYIAFATRVLIYAMAAASLNLVLGYGGMVSFGHAAFFGAGAYVVGILVVRRRAQPVDRLAGGDRWSRRSPRW